MEGLTGGASGGTGLEPHICPQAYPRGGQRVEVSQRQDPKENASRERQAEAGRPLSGEPGAGSRAADKTQGAIYI